MGKRVAILQSHIPDYRVPFFEGLERRLHREGIGLQVYAGTANRRDRARADSATPAWLHPMRQWEFALRGRRVVARLIPASALTTDLVILEQARRNLDVYPLLFLRRDRVALWGHGRDFVQDASPLRQRLLDWLTRRAAHFFVYTEAGRADLLATGLPPTRVTAVNNSKETAIRHVGLGVADAGNGPSTPRRSIAFVGALDASKRLDFLISAMAIVRDHHPDVGLCIIGAGPEQERLVEAYANEGWIRFAGRLAGEGLHDALMASRAIAMPGRVGLVVIDSFAAACPIVTTRYPYHAPEFAYLEDERNAIVTDDSNQAFAEGLGRVLSDDDLHARLRHGCVESSSHYSLASMVERFAVGVVEALKRTR